MRVKRPAGVPSPSRRTTGQNVLDAAIERLRRLYEDGHRLVYSFSGGKDSGVCVELGIVAARLAGCLPIDVVMRDEEIMYPGTFDYVERVYSRPEVRGRWLVAHQPVINIFNRAEPYYWVFDPLVSPSDWVRPMPAWAEEIEDNSIDRMTIPERFPPAPGKDLYAVIGLRVQESRGRMYGLFSSGGYLTKTNKHGVRSCRPIYDWTDADVWLAHEKFAWDYNRAYDAMYRLGVPRSALRIAPPVMNAAGARLVKLASHAWPNWFDRVCDRLPGVRQAALFGKAAVTPVRRSHESWEDCFNRECLGPQVPDWIRSRAARWRDFILSTHRHHSTLALPQVDPCHTCHGNSGCWRFLTLNMWSGDPFSVKCKLPDIEPEFFRPGSGTWGGKPTW